MKTYSDSVLADHVSSLMTEEYRQIDYYVFPNTLVTVCCLVPMEGLPVVGYCVAESALAFDEEIGQLLALTDALGKRRKYRAV